MDLKDKVALITGGARGIGFEIASVFAEHGAKVIIGDINEELLNEAVDKLKSFNTEAYGFFLDVQDYSSCEGFIKNSIDALGRVDILVNNAGITRDNLLMRMSEKDAYRKLKGTELVRLAEQKLTELEFLVKSIRQSLKRIGGVG